MLDIFLVATARSSEKTQSFICYYAVVGEQEKISVCLYVLEEGILGTELKRCVLFVISEEKIQSLLVGSQKCVYRLCEAH